MLCSPLDSSCLLYTSEGYQLVAVETGVSDANNTEIFWGVDEGATVYLNATPNTSNAVTDEENTAYNS